MHLAAERHGVLATRELADRGVSKAAISRARRTGKLIDVLPGVMRLASSADSFLTRCHALSLDVGDDGFLSAWTAGRLMELRAMPRQPIHVTVRTGGHQRMPGWVETHHTRWFADDPDRWTDIDGLTIASPMRTLWGLAAAFNQHRFERAAEDAWHRRLITPTEAAAYLEAHRCRGKDGVARLERWLEDALPRDRPTQSNFERRLVHRLAQRHLPTPKLQHPLTLPSGELIHIDIAWPNVRLGVEPGATWWHGGDLAMRRYQARDRASAQVGWLILRIDESVDLDHAVDEIADVYERRRRDLTGPTPA